MLPVAQAWILVGRVGDHQPEVAVKVLSRRLAGNNDAIMRFERETKAIAALSHPNIVAIFDVTQDRDIYFAVMELLEGESLKERLSRGPIPWNETGRIALRVAEGLAAVHATGVVHRDIKPGNIFLTTANGPKLLDFGLARMETNPPAVTSDDSSTLTQPTRIGTVMGTAAYMSPEQVRGQPADARSDVFSFGAVRRNGCRRSRPRDRHARSLVRYNHHHHQSHRLSVRSDSTRIPPRASVRRSLTGAWVAHGFSRGEREFRSRIRVPHL